MQLEQAQHAARVVALENAILGLLCESDAFGESPADGLAVTAQRDRGGNVSIGITYTVAGMAVSGEGTL